MQAIMISIQPQWVEKILNGEKTIEIRKTMPKCELPCKVYIYCTKQKRKNGFITKSEKFGWIMGRESTFYNRAKEYDANGKVVAEFTLNDIETIEKHQVYNASVVRYNACLNIMQLHDYIKGKRFHAWHIDNLKIYDKPKELSEFYTLKKCNSCEISGYECSACVYDEDCKIPVEIKRPPQSWCYVEEI